MRDEDAERVKAAQALKAANDLRTETAEFVRYQSWLARQRYVELVKQGFTEEQAIRLCTVPIKVA